MELFELDHPATADDKRKRLQNAGIVIAKNVHYIKADFTQTGWEDALIHHKRFNSRIISFCTLLGVVYYLSRQSFEAFLCVVGSVLPKGSALLFDYPDEYSYTERAGERAKKQAMLAGAANERMLASYSYAQMEQLLAAYGFLIYEHLTPQVMTGQYFSVYNEAHPAHPMTAFDNVNYCLAVKR